jgi:hypothetical protein
MQVLTNGLYTPTLHRVVNSSRRSAGAGAPARVSVPFFYEPAFEALVQPLPQLCRWVWGVSARGRVLPQQWCVTPAAVGCVACRDAPPRFAPLRYGSHLESKVFSNFEL